MKRVFKANGFLKFRSIIWSPPRHSRSDNSFKVAMSTHPESSEVVPPWLFDPAITWLLSYQSPAAQEAFINASFQLHDQEWLSSAKQDYDEALYRQSNRSSPTAASRQRGPAASSDTVIATSVTVPPAASILVQGGEVEVKDAAQLGSTEVEDTAATPTPTGALDAAVYDDLPELAWKGQKSSSKTSLASTLF